ncbi:MAG: hypothetical protein E7290_11950 [Lachnospiraceae bacterium]|nr:hypothetical protein [Lachnospiraceae bacterium]
MIRVCVMVAAGLLAAIILKKDRPEYATLVIILVSLMIALQIFDIMEECIREVIAWGSLLQENVRYIKLFLKIIGITYLCDFTSNMCKDAGYSSLSNHIELMGKVMIMLAGMPIIKTMLGMIQEIM